MASPSMPLRSFINGKRVRPSPQHLYSLYDAATGTVREKVQSATPGQIRDGVIAASESQERWARDYSPSDRSKVLLRAARILERRAGEVALAETGDTGRTVRETRHEAAGAADCLEYQAGAALTVGGQHVDLSGNRSWGYTRREPIGTTVGIGAWNYPLQSAVWKSAPALAFGNSMVFKPSELTPTTALILADAYSEAGLPDGVFNVILGDGSAGASLVSHEKVDKVSFTGSVETGSKVYTAAAESLKRVTLELGGKSPLIIFDDANIHDAVSTAMVANWLSSGQVCSNGTRVFVHESVLEKFLESLVKRTSRLKIGDPTEEATDLGPMISRGHMEKVMKYIQIGKEEDQADLLCGGEPILQETGGYYLSPAIFSNCNDNMRIVQDEIFGMVMSVLSFRDEGEVVQRANNTAYGLAAGVFTNDLKRAHRVVADLNVATTWINNYNLAPVVLPWGGFKKSGQGSENGLVGVESWTRLKAVYVEMGAIDCPYP